MSYKALPIICLIAFLMTACPSQPLRPPDWTYEKDAIQIRINSDLRLNFDEGVPHTLLMCLYQLKDPNAFSQLSEDTEGIYKLLDCNLFDTSVATAKRLIVRPGQDLTMTLDRAADAQYLAVVAGYYVLQKERMIRLYDIPVVEDVKGWFKKTRKLKPGFLELELVLGPSQIQ